MHHSDQADYPSLEPPIQAVPGDGFKVAVAVNEAEKVVVFHNRPFQKALSWLEFDIRQSKLDFIMNDGDIRPFAIPVHPDLGRRMQNTYQILMVLMDERTGQPVEGEYYPLILHAA